MLIKNSDHDMTFYEYDEIIKISLDLNPYGTFSEIEKSRRSCHQAINDKINIFETHYIKSTEEHE